MSRFVECSIKVGAKMCEVRVSDWALWLIVPTSNRYGIGGIRFRLERFHLV